MMRVTAFLEPLCQVDRPQLLREEEKLGHDGEEQLWFVFASGKSTLAFTAIPGDLLSGWFVSDRWAFAHDGRSVGGAVLDGRCPRQMA